jgi:hypothetical protein
MEGVSAEFERRFESLLDQVGDAFGGNHEEGVADAVGVERGEDEIEDGIGWIGCAGPFRTEEGEVGFGDVLDPELDAAAGGADRKACVGWISSVERKAGVDLIRDHAGAGFDEQPRQFAASGAELRHGPAGKAERRQKAFVRLRFCQKVLFEGRGARVIAHGFSSWVSRDLRWFRKMALDDDEASRWI